MIKVQCPFDPKIYKDSPMGMFHCPWCGEMQLAGLDHLPFEIEIEDDEYEELVENMKKVKGEI
jgi:hypothetical protein